MKKSYYTFQRDEENESTIDPYEIWGMEPDENDDIDSDFDNWGND